MRLILCVLIGLNMAVATTSATAEMTDELRGDMTRKAWACGQASQGIQALQITEHYPNFKDRFVEFARSQGASDWEIHILIAVFDLGVNDAIEQGVVVGPYISEKEKKNAISGIDKRVHRCFGYNWKDE